MIILTIAIKPEKVQIKPQLIARLMGIETVDIPEPYRQIIEKELQEMENYLNIKGGYRIINDIEFELLSGMFIAESIRFHPGKDILKNLKKSEKLAFYICTAGEEISLRSKDLMNSGNFLEGYIADLVGSVIVEKAMDIIHQKIKSEMKIKGFKITNRYSPGYCDWKVDEQHKLFGLFPSGFCGVQLSENALMTPIKSVSGIIGIGREVKYNNYICNDCSSVNCIYRNIKYSL